jgi:hypothetical protein
MRNMAVAIMGMVNKKEVGIRGIRGVVMNSYPSTARGYPSAKRADNPVYVTNKLKVRIKEGIFALVCITPMKAPVATPTTGIIMIENIPNNGFVSHKKIPPNIQTPTYDRSRRPVNTTNVGPIAKSTSVTNCLIIDFKFIGLKNLSGYMPPKITIRARRTMITGCIFNVCAITPSILFFVF